MHGSVIFTDDSPSTPHALKKQLCLTFGRKVLLGFSSIQLTNPSRVTSLRRACSYSARLSRLPLYLEVKGHALSGEGRSYCGILVTSMYTKQNTDPRLVPKPAKQACNRSMHLLSTDCLHIIKRIHPNFYSCLHHCVLPH